MNLEKEMELSLYADDTLIYIPIAELLFFGLDFFIQKMRIISRKYSSSLRQDDCKNKELNKIANKCNMAKINESR